MKANRWQSNTKNDPLLKFRANKGSPENVFEHEENAASLVGGKRHSGSGSQKFKKSDASSEDYQVECKQTEKESLSLKLEWLEKIVREADGKGKEPLLHVRFTSAQEYERDWVMIRASEFSRLISDDKGRVGMLVDSNGEKVYVHYNNGSCAARLCKLSAEFWDYSGNTCRTETIKDCTFEMFQQEVLKRFGLEVKESCRPKWSVQDAEHS